MTGRCFMGLITKCTMHDAQCTTRTDDPEEIPAAHGAVAPAAVKTVSGDGHAVPCRVPPLARCPCALCIVHCDLAVSVTPSTPESAHPPPRPGGYATREWRTLCGSDARGRRRRRRACRARSCRARRLGPT